MKQDAMNEALVKAIKEMAKEYDLQVETVEKEVGGKIVQGIGIKADDPPTEKQQQGLEAIQARIWELEQVVKVVAANGSLGEACDKFRGMAVALGAIASTVGQEQEIGKVMLEAILGIFAGAGKGGKDKMIEGARQALIWAHKEGLGKTAMAEIGEAITKIGQLMQAIGMETQGEA